jgi:hypothetical protein
VLTRVAGPECRTVERDGKVGVSCVSFTVRFSSRVSEGLTYHSSLENRVHGERKRCSS